MRQKQKDSASCVHKFQVDGQNIGTCSVCGERRQFPWDKGQEPVVLKQGTRRGPKYKRKGSTRVNNRKRHQYYEDHKEAIIADLLALGHRATTEKWGLPRNSVYYLEERWLTEEQRAAIPADGPHREPLTPSSSSSGNGQLPPFPSFSDKWEPEVQLQWLEVYDHILSTISVK